MNKFASAACLAALFCFLATSSVAKGADGIKVHFLLDAQPLRIALNQWAEQAGFSVVLPSGNAAAERMTTRLEGTYAPKMALNLLLEGSGLSYSFVDERTVAIIDAASASSRGIETVSAMKDTADRGRLAQAGIQNTEGKSRIDPLQVDGGAASTPSYSGEVVVEGRAIVTIGKTELPLREMPQSVTVVGRQRMDEQNLRTIEDVLREVPGVVSETNGNGTANFFSRGYGLDVQFDGVPATNGLNNSRWSFAQFDLITYEQVEVLRGPAGLLQGTGSPGGTVNFVRKRPQRQFAANGSFSVGSWDNYHADLDVTGPLNSSGSIRGRVVVGAQRNDFFYGQVSGEGWTGYGLLEADLGSRTTATMSAGVARSETPYFYTLPAYSDGRLLDLSRSTYSSSSWNQQATPMREASFGLTHHLSENWTLKLHSRYRESDNDYNIAFVGSGVDPDALVADYYLSGYAGEYTHLGADISLSGTLDFFGRSHMLVLGYNYDEFNVVADGYSIAFVPAQPVSSPSLDESLIPPITDFNGNREVQTGLYATARLKLLDPLTLVLGVRLSDYQSKFRTVAPVRSAWTQSRAKADGELSPYGGLVWELNRHISLYGSYADIFIPQSQVDFHRKVLEPRVGWQGEIGAKAEFNDGRFTMSLAAFKIRDTNRAMQDPDPTHVNCIGAFTNSCSIAAGVVESRGWEAEIGGSPRRGLQLFAGYTRNDTEFLRDTFPEVVGTPLLTTSPRHLVKLWGSYRFQPASAWSGWSVGAGMHSQTEIYSGESSPEVRRREQGGYTLFSAQAGYRFNERAEASLTITNLFDRVYYDRIGDVTGVNFYGEPRSFMLTLRSKL